MNLGSPNSTSVKDLRTYLNEFLMDGRVIDIPTFWRSVLVKGIIVPLRAPQSAKKYRTIWTKDGSPLVHTTNKLAELVNENMQLPTYVCMRYANPTPDYILNKIIQENPNVEEIVAVPLYPHYAMSSYESAVEHFKEAFKKVKRPHCKLSVVAPFYNDDRYVETLSNSISNYLQNDYDHILFSYHGIPERHVRKTDPTLEHCTKCENCCEVPSEAHKFCYQHQVKETTRLVANRLKLPNGKYSNSFQSRLGRDKWLSPATAEQFEKFPGLGIKNLVVVCPAFVSDCLETLEEIMEEGQEDFLKAGGEKFTYIPCLNTQPQWVKTLSQLINEV